MRKKFSQFPGWSKKLGCIALSLMLTVAAGCSSQPASKDSNSTTNNGGATQESTAKPADGYPENNIKFIVPFNAGGGADTNAREFAPYLEKELGQTLVIENRPGAGTQVALNAILTGKQDGYEIIQLTQPHASLTIHQQKASYTMDDFAMVNFHQIDPGAMCVLTDSPINSMVDLVELIKSKPGEIAIGTVQSSGPHLLLYWLQDKLQLDFIIVPYDGGAKARTALLGGEIDAFFGYAVGNYTMKDQTKTIGVSWPERSKLWPDAPTFQEELGTKYGLEVPPMASYRGLAFTKEFKEKYPERFQAFVELYDRAYHNKEFLDKYEAMSALNFQTPEEAQKMLMETDQFIKEYVKYFK